MSDVIVITGAGGFLGSRVVPLIRKAAPRARVIAVVRAGSGPKFGRGVDVIRGDLRRAATWKRLPSDVTHIIHLAARIPWDRRRAERASVIADNLTPIAHLVEASRAWTALRQVIYGSSVAVYAPSARKHREDALLQPATVYGAAKLCGEALTCVLGARGVAVAALRFSSLYGSGQYPGTVLPLFAARARQGLALDIFNARRVQDFLYVEDGARAVALAYKRGAHGAFNIGTGRAVDMAELAEEVVRCFGERKRSGINIAAAGPSTDPGTSLDISRARKALGFTSRVSLRAGLRRLAREIRPGAGR
jgi:UDP-glucose 4-epimerase